MHALARLCSGRRLSCRCASQPRKRWRLMTRCLAPFSRRLPGRRAPRRPAAEADRLRKEHGRVHALPRESAEARHGDALVRRFRRCASEMVSPVPSLTRDHQPALRQERAQPRRPHDARPAGGVLEANVRREGGAHHSRPCSISPVPSRTAPKHPSVSRRAFPSPQVREWRRKLHAYDPNGAEDGLEEASGRAL